VAQLTELVSQVRAAGLDADLTLDGVPVELSAGGQLAVYRIVQEALTNALKHAGPVATTVRVGFEPEILDLVVHSAAAARAPSGDGPGHGLIGMRERVALYEGTLRAEPDGRGGFEVHARIPFGRERV
jgi:signal transduction histidine kinase